MGRYLRTERGYEERTHWKEEIKSEVVLVDNLTSDDYNNDINVPKCNFISGQSYNVTLNGTLYEGLVCYSDGDYNVIGDDGIVPFYIDDDGGDDLYVSVNDGDSTWTLSISTIETAYIYHKLDPNYIPADDIAVQSDWNETDGTSKAFIQNKPPIIQDENGDVYLDKLHVGLIETAKKLATEEYWYEPKKHVVLTDEINGYNYIVSMRDGNLVSYCEASSISVTTMPNKSKYLDGDTFNPAGMIVTARCKDGSTREVNGFTYDSTVNSANVNSFIITYKEGNNTFTTTIRLGFHDFSLVDFNYTVNEDGTYTLTSWKGTYNGEPSTRIVVPNSKLIIV